MAMTRTKIPTFKIARKVIREKVRNRKGELTPLQKLEVLRSTRDLMATNYVSGTWRRFIDGVEHYCIYGALERVCGLEPDSTSDEFISSCSLTTTLYDAVPKSSRESTDKDIKVWSARLKQASHSPKAKFAWMDGVTIEDRDDPIGYCLRQIAECKVSFLQSLNDDGDKEAVLRVFDKAIKKLEKQTA